MCVCISYVAGCIRNSTHVYGDVCVFRMNLDAFGLLSVCVYVCVIRMCLHIYGILRVSYVVACISDSVRM